MPVTLTTANHAARRWTRAAVPSTEKLFEGSCGRDYRRSNGIIQSSFDKQIAENHVSPSHHGFVRSVYHAYSHHHHLTIRPEDVWFSILSQLNFFINAHAEDLRSMFVAYEGQKELVVKDVGNIHSVDFGALAVRMTELIQENVLDLELKEWIIPAFSTTTDSDRVVAAISMMGAMQKYFTYTMCLMCGIPSVTLLGERDDWELLVEKLDKIPKLGKEPTTFAQLLRPVLKRFVASFNNPSSPEVREFWNHCAHETGGSGPPTLSGWITAFCFWDEDGKCLRPQEPYTYYKLDGIVFHEVETSDIPAGYSLVPVKVNDNGREYDTKMLAGLVGIQVTSSGQELDTSRDHPSDGKMLPSTGLDSIKPLSGWWMYKEEDPSAAEARKNEKKAIRDELKFLETTFSRQEKWERRSELHTRFYELEQF